MMMVKVTAGLRPGQQELGPLGTGRGAGAVCRSRRGHGHLHPKRDRRRRVAHHHRLQHGVGHEGEVVTQLVRGYSGRDPALVGSQ